MSIEDTTVPVDIKKVDYTKDWDRDNPVQMHILGRTKGGTRVHLLNDEKRPYFYVPLTEFDQGIENSDLVTGIEYGYESIYGEDMVKIYTRIPGDVPKLRDKYQHHEADILFPNRFLIDAGIEGGINIPAEHASPEPSRISVDDVTNQTATVDSRICFCDIEVDDGEGFPSEDTADKEIVCITTYDSYLEQYELWMYHPELPVFNLEEARTHIYETEEAMMRDFTKYILETEPDVLAGWNFSDFDARYLLNRLEKIAEDLDLEDLDENSMSPLGVAYDEGYFGGKIKGISVFDMLRAYKTLQFSELDSYSLEDVAQEELGVGKVKDSRSIREQWHEDPERLGEYNVKDVKLTVMLEKEQAIIQFYEEIANYVGGRLSEVIGVHKAVDQKILRAVHDKYVVPSGDTAEGEGFEGATVFDPITGIKENVVVLDLKSLYPMCMKTLNAGPGTKSDNGDVTAPNGISFDTDEEAIAVSIIDEMLEKRQEYKDLRDACDAGSKQYRIYDIKQTAVKIVMNCFSGDTEILTPDGIRNIKDIEVGDVVYSINPDTGNIELKPVTNTIEQENQYGKLEHISTNNTDLKITPNHRMVINSGDNIDIQHYDDLSRGVNHTIPNHSSVKGERVDNRNILPDVSGRLWIETSVHGNTFNSSCPWEFKKHLTYDQNRRQYRLDDIELWEQFKDDISHMISSVTIQYDEKHSTIPIEYDMDDWLELLGWVISEGSFNSVDSKETGAVSYRGKSDRVNIAQKQPEHRTSIVDLVDRMGLNYSVDSNGVYLYNSNIHNLLIKEVGDGSYNKQIPDWVFESGMPGQQLKKLLFTLIDGDGDTTGDKSFRYSTASEQLKEDVMKLAVLCGYKVSSNKDSGVWRVYINKNSGSFNKGKNTTGKSHDGRVYCIEVEDNHTLMAGRNGKFQWTGNTLYGVMGWDSFRLLDEDVGAAVTATGRGVIEYTEQTVEELGYDVTYGDTDSVMIELGSDLTKEECIEAAFEMEEVINQAYDEYASEVLGTDEHFFQIEFEKLYKTYFQSGRKKRYAGHITWKEGKHVDKVDLVGFETNRSDYSAKAKEVITDVLETIVYGGSFSEVSQTIQEAVNGIKNEEFDMDKIAIPGGISKDFEDYDTDTLHVRGSKYAVKELGANIQSGDKPKGLYVKRILPDESGQPPYPLPRQSDTQDPFVCWMDYSTIPDEFVWDWETYIEKQIRGPIERILTGTDWTWEEVLQGKQLASLSDFEFEEEEQEATSRFGTFTDESDNSDDFSDLEGDELIRAKARKELSKAQNFLDQFDDEEITPDSEAQTIKIDQPTRTETPDSPGISLNDFEQDEFEEETVTSFKTDDGDDEKTLFTYLDD